MSRKHRHEQPQHAQAPTFNLVLWLALITAGAIAAIFGAGVAIGMTLR